MKKILLPISLLIAAIAGYTQPGSLDLSFASKGYVHEANNYSLHVQNNFGRQVLAHPDGSSYLVFTLYRQTFVRHFLANGSVDQSYGQGGYSVPTPLENSVAAMQPDGKIVLGGYISGQYDFRIVRLNVNGTLDNTFSNDGMQNIAITTFSRLQAIAVHNGKIVAAGFSYREFVIARLLSDGSPDNSFSDDGKQTVTFGNFDQSANAVAIAPNGRIVVAGTAQGNMAIAALLDNGSPDNSFSDDGRLMIQVEGSTSCSSVAIQPDGKIILAGDSENGGIRKWAVARLNTDGSMDNNFSGDGKLSIDFGKYTEARAVVLQSNGKIIIAGMVGDQDGDLTIASINADGTTDYGFSGDGIVIISLDAKQDAANAVAIQPDGRILVAGYAGNWSFTRAYYLMLRYTADGMLDNSFSDDGIVIGYKPVSPTAYVSGVIQPDGKLLVLAGVMAVEHYNRIGLVRYNTDGSLDNSFSGDGKLDLDLGAFGGQNPEAIVLQPDGKIVVGANQVDASGFYFMIVRFNPDGTLDNSFSGDGRAIIDFEGAQFEDLKAIALQSDGKIVAAGAMRFTTSMSMDVAVGRLNADGTPDNSFSGDGKVVTDLGGDESVWDVATTPDGKIVVGGTYQQALNVNVMLVKYNSDGTLDQSFNGSGWVNNSITGNCEARAIDLLPDGKIVVGGTFLSGIRYLVAKYTPNGILDNSFSGDGIAFENTDGNVVDMAIQPNGKIILAGFSSSGTGTKFARFNSDGTTDPAFISESTANTEFAYLSAVQDILIHANRLYAVGAYANNGGEGYVAAFKLDCSLNVSIPDAFTLPSGVDVNTVYIGYAPASDITLSAQVSGGTAPYSYLWSNGATTSSITIVPGATANWTVTATDALGCNSTAGKVIAVRDIRCGNNKVLICQVPKGNPANAKTLCVNTNAVNAHLNNGGYLGNCNYNLITKTAQQQPAAEAETSLLTVYPNPTSTQFTLSVQMPAGASVTVVIFDNLGREVERRQITPGQHIKFGINYKPGIYFIECRQGAVIKRTKLVKG